MCVCVCETAQSVSVLSVMPLSIRLSALVRTDFCCSQSQNCLCTWLFMRAQAELGELLTFCVLPAVESAIRGCLQEGSNVVDSRWDSAQVRPLFFWAAPGRELVI